MISFLINEFNIFRDKIHVCWTVRITSYARVTFLWMLHAHEASYINGIVSDWTEFYYKITHGHLLDVNKTRKTCFIKDLRAAEISSWLSPGPVYPDKLMYDQTITSSAHCVDVAACLIFSWFHLINKRNLRLGLIIIRLTVISLLCGRRVSWRRAIVIACLKARV